MNKQHEIAKMNRNYERDGAFAHLRAHSRFVPGDGPLGAKVMLIGEAPGRVENAEGRPFVGRAGALLDRMLEEYGGVRREYVYVTNIVKYRPPGNRDPLPEEVLAARSYLGRELVAIDPGVVVLVGKFAYQLVFGEEASISRDHGKERERRGRMYLPTYHPAAVLYNTLLLEDLRKDFSVLRRLILEA